MQAILLRHRRVVPLNEPIEPHFFTHTRVNETDDLALERREWYSRLKPAAAANGTLWTYDKSPSYMDTHLFPDVPALARQLLPSAKVVALVCEPIARAWSQFHHLKRHGYFEPGIEQMEDLMSRTSPKVDVMEHMVATGFYAEHLQAWMDVYDPGQIFVADLGEMASEDKDVRRSFVLRLLAFLGLPAEEYDWDQFDRYEDYEIYRNPTSNYTREPSPAVVEWLQPYYEEKNQELADLLGLEYPRTWNDMYY